VIEALTPIADEEVIVAFGRAARAMPDLTRPVLEALDQLDDPHAAWLHQHCKRTRRR